jgi:hypothetical protein
MSRDVAECAVAYLRTFLRAGESLTPGMMDVGVRFKKKIERELERERPITREETWEGAPAARRLEQKIRERIVLHPEFGKELRQTLRMNVTYAEELRDGQLYDVALIAR